VPYLVGAVVIVGVLALLNLLLTFGVIRRLREHTERLSRPAAGLPDLMVGVGESPGSFTARTTEGEQVSLEALAGGEQLVGFFSPSCQPCKEVAPAFVARAAAGGQTRALAVVVGGPEEVGDLVTWFAPVARVVVEADVNGAVASAFRVNGFPALCLLDADGVVTASGHEAVQAVDASAAA
jgi:AhpC/TSA family